MPRRQRLTSRGRVALLVVVVLVLGGLTTTGVVLWRKFFGHDCVVEVSGRTVHLDRDVAMKVTTAAARAVRRDASVLKAVGAAGDLTGSEAEDVAAAASGKAHATLTCTGGGAGSSESDDLSDAGLTHRAEVVRADMKDVFGDLPLGGFEPGGVTTGHMPGSAHYEGRAIDVFFRPINDRNKVRGWALAQYLVAHAERLRINTVIFDDQIWTARRGFQGWRDYDPPSSSDDPATQRILEHRDHVHVDVAD